MLDCVILVYPISVSFFDKIYTIELSCGLELLDYLKPVMRDMSIVNMDETSVSLIVQQFFDASKLETDGI